MIEDPSDQEIMEAVRKHEAQELDHVNGLLAKVEALMPEVEKLIAEERRRTIRREPTLDDKFQMVREHAVRRYFDRHLRNPQAMPSVDLTGVDERASPVNQEAAEMNEYVAARRAQDKANA